MIKLLFPRVAFVGVQQQFGFAIPDEDAHEITTMGQAISYTNRRLQEQS